MLEIQRLYIECSMQRCTVGDPKQQENDGKIKQAAIIIDNLQ